MILFNARKVLAILILFLSTNALAYELTGKVIKVVDGDTVHLMLPDYSKHKIRLASIDAPEKGQPFGNKSRKMLLGFVSGKQITADCTEKDRYHRDVCTLFKNGLDINAEMVANGGAWVYRKYYDGTEYYQFENDAKAQKRGLWKTSEAQTIEPWKWRRGVNNDANAPHVKLSKNKICHEKGTRYYNRVKRYKAFQTISECLKNGRLPK